MKQNTSTIEYAKISLSLPKNHLASIEGFLHIYEPLVGRATEEEVGVAERLHEGTIDENIQILKQRHHNRVVLGKQTFPCITSIAPDSLVRLEFHPTGKFGTPFCLKERVATRECNLGKRVVNNNTHQVVN